jgi:phosphate transport system permease protein
MATLPTMINQNRNDMGLEPAFDRVWAAALTLILIVLLLNIGARVVARYSKVS